MATLAESFLADLEDLSEEEEENEKQHITGETADAEGMEVDAVPAIGTKDRLEDVAQLASSERYRSIMGQVTRALEEADPGEVGGGAKDAADQTMNGMPQTSAAPSEEDPTYRLLVECNRLAVDIENEITAVFNFLKERYRSKFPELESLVKHPLDYARVVRAIGNEMDVTQVDLDALLPPATVMVVTVTATTTSGAPLAQDRLEEVYAAADLAQRLDADKASILRLVQRRMDRIAPNLSAAVGTEVAAQLMGIAGGLGALSQMPACNVQVLGAKRRTLAGFSSKAVQPHQGFIYGCDLIQNTPPGLRPKAARLVGAKCALLARMDAHGKDPDGAAGRAMRADMLRKIEKWQEPPPARKGEVLPVPDAGEIKKKRRGGKRYRKLKERYGMTELKKQANRMGFNQPEEEVIDGEETLGLGVIGKEGAGKLRAVAAQQRQKLSAKAAKKFGVGPASSKYGGVGGAVSGLSSSLAFTPIQGIELVNPELGGQGVGKKKEDFQTGTESYFSEYSGFRSGKRPKT